jgi:hypothetical protein
MNGKEVRYRLPTQGTLLFGTLAVLGAVALVTGLSQTPERSWADLWVIGNYLIGMALGGLLLVALHYVTGARWSTPVRRIPEGLTAVLPVGTVGLIAVLVCWPSLYSAPIDASESPLHQLWLNRPFLIVRSLAYLAIWLAFAVAIVRNSRRQDDDPDPGSTRKNRRLSAFFLVVFGVTCWLASNDWIMALEPNWTSTIFGVYNFAGLFLSALAAMALLVVWLRRQDSYRAVVNQDHLHDLGTLLFAFSSFWMYTWFCQYLLIWYVNNPEETAYFRRRWQGGWPTWLYIDLALNWGIPFLVLLFRSAKRSPVLLGTIALLILAGRWVDLGLMILPSQGSDLAQPGTLEAGFLLGTGGIAALAVFRALRQAPLVPLNEPGSSEKREQMPAKPAWAAPDQV